MILYKHGEDPYDLETFSQFKGNLVNYWDSTAGIGPELAKVAIHIHGVCINSASVERLWSSMGFLHTNRRNKLKSKKVLAMSQIRSDILYHRQKKNAKELDTKVQRLHIATPIIEDDNINNPEFNNLTDDDLLVSDDDNGENESNNLTLNDSSKPHTEEQEQGWNIFVKEWIEAIKRENTFDHSEDEILLDGEMDNDFNFGGRTIHPADNLTAKWPLRSLFISNLGFPAYLQGNQIYSAL
ncbi:hypothetical protein RirG_121730 [Rhizophagus irregularis DAOM 197198w]|uniref:HAT C-terminal dimerisation domain-containing protein n=1 Tax=Rhizophagus irregularis (strain DAOM 197198w) TaxID=1432141 RepID=A0A015JHU1_RHIIW|nr:hypothetical protein RirG_121730 [Rhizophagus irregularis DAOM 197198w]